MADTHPDDFDPLVDDAFDEVHMIVPPDVWQRVAAPDGGAGIPSSGTVDEVGRMTGTDRSRTRWLGVAAGMLIVAGVAAIAVAGRDASESSSSTSAVLTDECAPLTIADGEPIPTHSPGCESVHTPPPLGAVAPEVVGPGGSLTLTTAGPIEPLCGDAALVLQFNTDAYDVIGAVDADGGWRPSSPTDDIEVCGTEDAGRRVTYRLPAALTPGAYRLCRTDVDVLERLGPAVAAGCGDFEIEDPPPVTPAPSTNVDTTMVTGEPEPVQKVFGVGDFAYHAISAFDSIWIAGKNSRTVARIDATTGELLATIPIDGDASVGRLAASGDAVYATATPVVRIDPDTNTAARIDGGLSALRVTADGDTVWAGGRDGIERIDPDGTITDLDVPEASWFDLAHTDDTVWALSQQPARSTLLGIDATTGEVLHDVALPVADNEYAVRIVADGGQIFIGTDASGGGGRAGRILVVDAASTDIIGDVSLDSRPEGIVVTERYIWTSGAVIDRTDLSVVADSEYYGFTLTAGPDGSIWGTFGIPGAIDAEGVATRWAPGRFGAD